MWGSGYQRSRRGLPFRFILAILIALGSVVSYLSTRSQNEVTGEVQHVALSVPEETALGLQAAPQMARQYGGTVEDPELVAYVNQVGDRVVAQSDAQKTPYKFDFHVLADSHTVNAFALPGGQVFITLALLRRLSDESELAGVLGHEVGHVVGRHGAEQLAKQRLTTGLVGAAGVASYDPNDPYRASRNAAVAAAAMSLVNMKFGRDDELESDRLGVRFMKQAGYDPEGMISLMKVLEAAGGGARSPEFFSTHPNPGNRIAQLRSLIDAAGGAGGERGADRFEQFVRGRLGALTAP